MSTNAAPLALGELLPVELKALQGCYLKELQSDPRWMALSLRARHVLRYRIAHMGKSGENFAGERRMVKLIPAFDSGGRPSKSGHISRMTLRKADDELEAAGFLTSWRTSGTVREGLRTRGIDVKRIAHGAWIKAWARFKAWRESMRRTLASMRRRTLDHVYAKAYVRGRAPRGAFPEGHGGWKVPAWMRDNDSRARARTLGLPPPGWEAAYPYTNENGHVLYTVYRYPEKQFKHFWNRLPEEEFEPGDSYIDERGVQIHVMVRKAAGS